MLLVDSKKQFDDKLSETLQYMAYVCGGCPGYINIPKKIEVGTVRKPLCQE